MGVNIAVVTYDRTGEGARFAQRHGIGFPILSDPDSRIIRAFGMLDTSQAEGSFAWGIALPVTFLIGPDGIIRQRFSEGHYETRPDPDAVIEAIGKGR